ncbi:alpha/beta hydrolase family protein [Stappia sp.]|uniref:alpha/beta hydrolase family protein n=1 Tax=Stappia sp. TaxID=1870903 RepID=UPI003A9A4504
MPGRKTVSAAIALLAIVLVAAVLASGLSDFDVSGRDSRQLVFASPAGNLSGTLLLPASGETRPPVVIVVHGDGPQDRYSAEGYLPLFNALLDAGIGVFSWDKPGIGGSEGDWRDQSMAGRAAEAEAARDAVRRNAGNRAGLIGFLGFSQAGWVLPRIAARAGDETFFVLVGGAVNWQRQGDHLTRSRMRQDGTSDARIAAEIARQNAAEAALADVAEGAARDAAAAALFGVPRERARFILRNRDADASADLQRAGAPFMAIWGKDDLNVDARTNARDYEQLLRPNNPANRVVLIPDATHGLLRARLFNYQLPQDMPWWARAAFVLLGRYAYAEGAIATIVDWIRELPAR